MANVNSDSSFEFDGNNNVVCWRLRGEVTEESFAESLRQVPHVLAGAHSKSGIIDLSGVTAFRVSVGALKKLALTKPVFRESFRA